MKTYIIATILAIASSLSALGEDLTFKFINKSGEPHKGCAFLAWDKTGKKHMDGVRPVMGNETITFKLPDWKNYTHWQFLASLDYSDNPNDFRVVMVDTGKRKVEKAEYSVEVTKGN